MEKEWVNKGVILLCTLFISAVFLTMIRQFLMVILLAGIFSAMVFPAYRLILKRLGGKRPNLASMITLFLVIVLVLIPLGSLLGLVAAQAIKVGHSAKPWIEKQLSQPGGWSELTSKIPYYEYIEPYRDLLLGKIGEMVGAISGFLIDNLQSAALGTVNFLFLCFVFLYCMFFFLIDGPQILRKILYYLPLVDEDETRILDRFTSVTRATLKGTLVIGVLQGGLAGLAFFAVGISGALFWSAIMSVLSIIPGIGTALVWGPAAIILAAGGHWIKAGGLILFCGLVVGSVDNFLRPRLVGKDTQMHELMIFFSTMGGLVLFGIAGFIIGPIIAAIFVTFWDIYGVVFEDYLPKVDKAARELSFGPEARSAPSQLAEKSADDTAEEQGAAPLPTNDQD